MAKTISFDDLNEVNIALQDRTEDARIDGANLLMKKCGFKVSVNRVDNADMVLREFLNARLKEKDFLAAATFLFGFNLFDPRPVHMAELYEIANNSARLSVVGAASSSKSFGLGIWLLMDYLRDPRHTKVFVASMQEKHLRQELFADLIRAVNNSVIDLGLETSSSGLKIIPKGAPDDSAGIFGKAFPQDDNSSTGRFRGLKPKNRADAHPEFGTRTRIRIFIDEASSVTGGVFMDLGSVEASIDGNEIVKIMMAFNPTDTNHPTCKLSEPDGGIYSLDPDRDYHWLSRQGWNVYRLDGARSPNVLARKNICAGVMSYEAFLGYLKAGDNSAKYWVYGRGIWAMQGAVNNVMPMEHITKNIGEFIYPDGYDNVASVDLAFGGDKVIFTLGRWGKAAGWVNKAGERELFTHEGQRITKWSLQVDQQFEIQGKHDSITLGDEIMKLAKQMKVKAKWLCLDRTGIGKGTYDQLRLKFGDVYGINWQDKAGVVKITVEDSETPHDRYANISSEMWFGTASWLEHGLMKISQFINPTPLFHQLTSRRYKSGRGGKAQVESKPEYKSRGHSNSPDEADSFAQLPLLCRHRGSAIPSVRGIDEDKLKDDKDDWDDDDEEYPTSSDTIDNLTFDGGDGDFDPYEALEEYAT